MKKHLTLVLAPIIALILAPATPLSAIETFADFSIGNLGFTRDREAQDEGLPDNSFPWAFSLGIRYPAFETMDFEMAVRRHHVIGNTTELLLTHRSNFVELGVGPYLGVYNNEDKPFLVQTGVYSQLRFNLGHFGFVSLRTRAPLYDDPSRAGEFRQRTQEYEFGLFVPNVVLSLYYGSFTFEQQTEDDYISDFHRAYEIRAHVFQKNVPYRVDLSFGYHDYEKEFLSGGQTPALGALIAGTRVSVDLSRTLTASLDLESALYSFGRADLLGDEGGNTFFFRAGAAFTYRLSADK